MVLRVGGEQHPKMGGGYRERGCRTSEKVCLLPLLCLLVLRGWEAVSSSRGPTALGSGAGVNWTGRLTPSVHILDCKQRRWTQRHPAHSNTWFLEGPQSPSIGKATTSAPRSSPGFAATPCWRVPEPGLVLSPHHTRRGRADTAGQTWPRNETILPSRLRAPDGAPVAQTRPLSSAVCLFRVYQALSPPRANY